MLRGLSYFLPVPPGAGAAALLAAVDWRITFRSIPALPIKTQLLHMYRSYILPPFELPPRSARDATAASVTHSAAVAQRVALPLFDAWKQALLPRQPPRQSTAVVVIERTTHVFPRDRVTYSPIRRLQHTLLRRHVFALHFSHAMFQSVQMPEGDMASELALGVVEHVVSPVLKALPPEE